MSRTVYLYFHGIGDSLLFNTILFNLGKQTGRKFFVASPHPEIYRGNLYVLHLPVRRHETAVHWRRFWNLLSLLKIVKAAEYIDYFHPHKNPQKHICELLCGKVGLFEKPSRPMVLLSSGEKARKFFPESGLGSASIPSVVVITAIPRIRTGVLKNSGKWLTSCAIAIQWFNSARRMIRQWRLT
jgi:hypothetical protein